MPRSKVVITGLGVVSSVGMGCADFFDALLRQRSGIRSLADRTDEGAKPGVVCEPPGLWIGAPVTDFEPKLYVRPRKALKVMCREIQTAFAASQLAIEHAGLSDVLPATDDGVVKPADVGTVFGGEMYYGPPKEMADPINDCVDDGGQLQQGQFGNAARRGVMPLWMLKYLPNMPACHVGISVNAHGPNNSLVLGDVSASAALMESVSCIERGIAKIVITGASGTRINTTRMNYRQDLPIAAVADTIPNSSRPHDPSSVGVVGGEGAGVLVLECAEHAAERGAEVIARVAGCASRFVASATMRNGRRTDAIDDRDSRGSVEAIHLAIQAAIADAEIESSAIGLIVGHAMGDPVMDACEREAIRADFRATPMVAPIASIGHAGAGAGAIALVTAALCIANRKIPPTLNAAAAAEGANLLQSAAELKEDQYVLCLSHTSEGNATAVVLSP